jgi:hypothetical protein
MASRGASGTFTCIVAGETYMYTLTSGDVDQLRGAVVRRGYELRPIVKPLYLLHSL